MSILHVWVILYSTTRCNAGAKISFHAFFFFCYSLLLGLGFHLPEIFFFFCLRCYISFSWRHIAVLMLVSIWSLCTSFFSFGFKIYTSKIYIYIYLYICCTSMALPMSMPLSFYRYKKYGSPRNIYIYIYMKRGTRQGKAKEGRKRYLFLIPFSLLSRKKDFSHRKKQSDIHRFFFLF